MSVFVGVTLVCFQNIVVFRVAPNGFMQVWSQLGVTLAAIFINNTKVNGRKLKNEPQNRCRMALVIHIEEALRPVPPIRDI